MQADERVRVEPVAPGTVSPIDHHDVGVRPVDQRIHERHPGRTRADYKVIGLDLAQDFPSLLRRLRRHGLRA
jgi:hypothetical protein